MLATKNTLYHRVIYDELNLKFMREQTYFMFTNINNHVDQLF